MIDAPSKKELLGLRLQATCRGNERLRTLMMCLGLTVGGMFDELMEQGWSDAEATQSIVDALTEVQQGLMGTSKNQEFHSYRSLQKNALRRQRV